MAIARKIGAIAVSGAVAGGMLIAGAGAANAASNPKVSGPAKVKAGKTFVLDCTVKGTGWAGADAFLMEKGASINAHRTVSSNGDCSFHVVLFATGKRQLRVVVDQNMSATQSKWITVNVTN